MRLYVYVGVYIHICMHKPWDFMYNRSSRFDFLIDFNPPF